MSKPTDNRFARIRPLLDQNPVRCQHLFQTIMANCHNNNISDLSFRELCQSIFEDFEEEVATQPNLL